MNYLILLSVSILSTIQNSTKKIYNKSDKNGVFCFNLLLSVSALLFFIITSKSFDWNVAFLPYSVTFALSYSMASLSAVLAIKEGPLGLSSLFISFSLVIPALYGLIFLNEPLDVGVVLGMVLIILSLILINLKDEKQTKLTLKWWIFAILASLGNGFCSLFQKLEQDAFDGAYKNEFMIASLSIVFAFFLVLVLTKERKSFFPSVKNAWYLPVICGFLNGLMNFLVMYLSTRLPASILYPTISAGGIILTYIISRVVFREKLSRKQFIGFVFGVLAVVFLNL